MSETQLQTVEPVHQIQTKSFFNPQTFDEAARMAKALAQSTIVPKDYQGKPENCLIALEMAQRIGASVMMVMQNLYVIQGRPSWSSQFIISALNSCGRFSPLRFELKKLQKETVEYEETTWENNQKKKTKKKVDIENMECFAWAYDSSGEKLIGPSASIRMAAQEGWYTKEGSKWQTMPELMIRYRSAAFFGRLYAPEVLNGMYTEDETYDIVASKSTKPDTIDIEIVPELPKKEEPKSATEKLKGVLFENTSNMREPGEEG